MLEKGVVMTKKIAALLTGLVCLVLFSGLAQAADKKFYIGVYGLYAWQDIDEQQTKNKFTGPIEVKFDDSWGIQARAGYIYNTGLTLEAMAEYITPFQAGSGGDKDDLDVKNFSINAKMTYPGKVFVPYLLAGIGVMNAHEYIKFSGAKSETSDWGVGLRGGVGFDFYVHKSVSLGLEGAYSLGTGNVDHIRYTTLALGASYHF